MIEELKYPIGIRADFLSSQILFPAILLQNKSIMQMLAANILMRISIVKIVYSHDKKACLNVQIFKAFLH